MTEDNADADLDRLARRRAGAKLGWYVHAAVYAIVISGLAALSAWQGRAWAAFPAMGWGLGLAIHAAVVWLAAPGASLHERLVRAERDRLRARAGRR